MSLKGLFLIVQLHAFGDVTPQKSNNL